MNTAAPPARRDALRPDGLLASDLWLDQPDALERIGRRVASGELTAEEGRNLEQLVRDGYLVFRPAIPEATLEEVLADVERIWKEQPPFLAWAYHSRLTRFAGRDHDKRKPSCRLADIHDFSPAAMALYLQAEIHRYISLIFESPAVATQSLFFEWGSQQALHRDPIHVQMEDPSSLLAAWIALEDIDPGSGPLTYVPGSHRLPYYQFEPGRYVHDWDKDGNDGIFAAQEWDRQHCERAGLAPVAFLPKKGEVLIWHHSLLHGGSVQTRPELTRKSFVIHFTRQDRSHRVVNRYDDPWSPGAPMDYSTTRQHRLGAAVGYESPLWGRFLEEARVIYDAGAAQLVRRVEAMEASFFWRLRNRWFALKRGLGLTAER